ncbi:MAG: efflux RND transporter periplasmic adaptor subunit [Deltaproteobacteria bacterium]|nr:efflux RND transporter periplasmic adaptor subunit [Deltaproteobacteria bacterium]
MKKLNLLFLVTCFLLSALVTLQGCKQKSDALPSAHQEHAHENHHEGHEHGEEGEGGDLSMSVEEITETECEHGIPAFQCEECRYEVGVVKVDEALIKQTGKTGSALVGTARVMTEAHKAGLNVTGEMKLNENTAAHISPKIEGVIHAVNVDFGSRVKKNDILFAIESPTLSQAVGKYAKHLSMVELHSKIYVREKSLYEQKITSEQELLEARVDLEREQADLHATKKHLQVLGLTEKDIDEGLKNNRAWGDGILPIRSPIDGTIIEKHAVVGELVEPTSDTMLVANLDTVWVWADIYEHDLSAIVRKMKDGPIPVEVRQAAFPDQSFYGHIDYVGATMDEQTRTVKVRAVIDNQDGLLRPGMFCEVAVQIGSEENVLTIPKSALLFDEGATFVYKHWRDDYYLRRPVKKGREFSERVEITEGIAPGEIIVTDAAFLLKSDTLRSKMGAGCAD